MNLRGRLSFARALGAEAATMQNARLEVRTSRPLEPPEVQDGPGQCSCVDPIRMNLAR